MALQTSSNQQQYQLKLAILHQPLLKTTQLLQFLCSQCNQFLHCDLPQYIKGEQKFIAQMQPIDQQINDQVMEEYVGVLMVYSTGSMGSYQFFRKVVDKVKNMEDLFVVVVEMDNTDKQANVIGNQGERFCAKLNLQYVRLTLYNSEDLVNILNKNLYQLIQNYYIPNEQQPQAQILQQPQTPQSSNFIFSYTGNQINAYPISPQKQKQNEILLHAQQMRKSRERQILMQEQQIDQQIMNVQEVLNNINDRIRDKYNSRWFVEMKESLYRHVEKQSTSFNKIKLTQQFLDQPNDKHSPYNKNFIKSRNKSKNSTLSFMQSRLSDQLSLSTKNFSLNFNTLKFNSTSLKSPVTKLVLFLSKNSVIQLQVYENSTYQQLAQIALKRADITQTNRNVNIMISKIRKRIEMFTKELQRAIKSHQQKKIHQRSFLKSKITQQQ